MSYTLSKTGAQIDNILDRADTGGAIDQSIALKAPLSSPAFTGTPTAPTPEEGDDSTQVATTAFVKSAAAATSYDLLVTDTAQGAIATFPDGADNVPVKSLIAQITPLQDLHGQSAPWPAGGGKNKLNATETGAYVTLDNGVYTVSSSPSSNNAFDIATVSLKAGNYLINGGNSQAFRWYIAIEGTAYTSNSSSDVAVTIPSDGDYAVKGVVNANTATGLKMYPMIRLATESDPTFAPYSNECPISGWTGAEVNRTGKNLFDYAKAGNITVPGGAVRNGEIIRISAGDWAISKASGGTVLYYAWNDGTAHESSMISVLESHFTAAADCDLYLWVGSGANISSVTNLQLEKGSTATTYEAYNGNTINVDWTDEAGTVYGGTLTYIGGGKYSLQATKGYADLGTVDYAYLSDYGYFAHSQADYKKGDDSVISSILPWGGYKNDAGMVTASDGIYRGGASSDQWKVKITGITTVEDLRTALAGQIAVYPLATLPDPIILDAEDVKTLLGENNIFCDTGNVDVTYRADTALYIDKKLGQ